MLTTQPEKEKPCKCRLSKIHVKKYDDARVEEHQEAKGAEDTATAEALVPGDAMITPRRR